MFHVYSVQGHVLANTLEDVRRLSPVSTLTRTRRISRAASGLDEPLVADEAARGGTGSLAAAAYTATVQNHQRELLSHVSHVMHRPALTIAASATVADAWQTLMRDHIGQAPVVSEDGALVGLVGRAELLPLEQLAHATLDGRAWDALLAQSVAAVMWSPVPSVLPDTDLRHAAALLLTTGLPGAPVTDETGRLIGFVSRSDLLRAMVTDPPLDLWG